VLFHSIDQKTEITYQEAYSLSNRMAHYFARMGVQENDRIVLLGDNSLEYLLLMLGALRYGATVCTINLEMNEAHIPDILRAIHPRILLWQSDCADKQYMSDRDSSWIRFDRWPVSSDPDPAEFFAMMESEADGAEISPINTFDSIATILYTSGTTDRPKGVLYTYRSRYHTYEALNAALQVCQDDRILEYRSLGWASAQSFGLGLPLLTGASACIAKRFSQSRFFDWTRDFGITVAVGIPAVINMLLADAEDGASDRMSTVRFLTSSTSALHLEQQKRFEETFRIPIVQAYGMSEAGWLAANSPSQRKLGSVGRPCRFQDLRIVDSEKNALAAGEIGEIETSGPCIAAGYLSYDGTIDPIASEHLKTGDLGYLDRDGFLFITGRSKDLIIRGGVNISPIEIENVLLQHPAVLEAVAFGVPDTIYGEELEAWISVREGMSVSPDQILEHCALSLPAYKCPKRTKVVSGLPKTERGKTDRAKVVEMWLAESSVESG
jgi:acyl-CoA synthetase (AMP-forming)/AMP-acid ligase II